MMDKELKLETLVSFKKANKMLRFITLGTIMAALLFAAVVFIKSVDHINSEKGTIYVIDKSGAINMASQSNENETRLYEYEDAIKNLYTWYYSFDEGSYKKNMEKCSNIFGTCGPKLIKLYEDEETYTKLRTKNLRLTIEISDPRINISGNPVTGSMEGIQTTSMGEYNIKQKYWVTFTIYDVARTRKNPHGVKVENWIEKVSKAE